MSAAPNNPLVQRVSDAIWKQAKSQHHSFPYMAQAALAACEFEELRECVRLLLLSSKGQCAHDPEVLIARQRKAEALLARLDGKP